VHFHPLTPGISFASEPETVCQSRSGIREDVSAIKSIKSTDENIFVKNTCDYCS
jgi:hypothetical protein